MPNEASLPAFTAQALDNIKVGTVDGNIAFNHSNNPINNYVLTQNDKRGAVELLKAAFAADVVNPQAEMLAPEEMLFSKTLTMAPPEGTPIGKLKDFIPEYIRDLALGGKKISEFAQDYKKDVVLERAKILQPVYDRFEVVYNANLRSAIEGTPVASEFSLLEFWKSVPRHISEMMPDHGHDDPTKHAESDLQMIAYQATELKQAHKPAAKITAPKPKKELPKKEPIKPRPRPSKPGEASDKPRTMG